MDTTIVFNPRSGRGKAESRARRLTAEILKRGVAVRLSQAAEEGRLNIILGGDGTIHHALPLLIRTATPVYHAPAGTANLFAREFSMSAAPEAVVAAIADAHTRTVDVGEANGKPFAVMLSVGPDAGVVHRLAAHRNGPISMASYVAPAWRELMTPHLPMLTIHADGTQVFHGRGMAVVANIRHYGGGFNPASGAIVDDGLLDLAVLPASTGASMAVRLGLARLRLPWGIIRVRGREFNIHSEGPARYQADGEAVEFAGDTVRVRVSPACLRVVSPSPRANGAHRPL